MNNCKEKWRWPVDIESYDRSPILSSREKEQIACLATRHVGSGAGPWPEESKLALMRLTRPLHDVLDRADRDQFVRHAAVRAIIREMHRRGRPFWSWRDPEWLETVGPTNTHFLRRHQYKVVTARQPIFAIAYLLGGFKNFDLFPTHGIELSSLAETVFGKDALATAAGKIFEILLDWGYKSSTRERLHTALCYVILTNKSPFLEDLTLELLTRLKSKQQTTYGLTHIYPISRALAHLKIIPEPVHCGRVKIPLLDRVDTSGIASNWVDWCFAWHAQSTWTARVKKQSLFTLLQMGRWLAETHPKITSPEQWDYNIAADFVAAVDQMKVGDWRSRKAYPRYFNHNSGKPLTPRAKACFLHRARSFFIDLQETPIRVGKDQAACLLPRRFNPLRVFRIPPAIQRLISPNPRVIDEKLWLKLLHAAETLERSDLRSAQLAMYPFELVQAAATTWCLSGLRGDEIRRLRVGCIRWRIEDTLAGGSRETQPEDAVCFLSVPVNKTGTAFTKPVHYLVGKRIEAWERVRPRQIVGLDSKTNEMVDFLFFFRGVRIAPAYINRHLIPLLCSKANLPLQDALGKITAHRARSTIASALYNAPEGLSIGELGEWLGHKDLRSTQCYAKLHPTRLAKSISRANKSSHLAKVIVDPGAAAKGDPAIFYYLGDGAYCANPAWAACPHRMACLKCPMYVPQSTAKLIEARQGILHLMEEIPLSDEEKAVAEGDVQALNRYIDKRANLPAPPVPDRRYVFNSQPGNRLD